MSYYYGMRLRGFSPGCQPKEGFLQRVDDYSGRYWDIIEYSRELTEQEAKSYDLDYLPDIWGQTEVCPHCETENFYPFYDTTESGYVMKCKCGREIFLCDACLHADDNKEQKCDWSDGKCFRGCCR